MSDGDNDLLGISIDADDYAEAAVGDTPSVSRTYQSEAAFAAQKATYRAKIDGGRTYVDLIAAVPVLGEETPGPATDESRENGASKVKLSKKDTQLLGYAVGELYYDREYERLLRLCEKVHARCVFDDKTKDSLARWTSRCRQRLSLPVANGVG